jgi:hypothetical protein
MKSGPKHHRAHLPTITNCIRKKVSYRFTLPVRECKRIRMPTHRCPSRDRSKQLRQQRCLHNLIIKSHPQPLQAIMFNYRTLVITKFSLLVDIAKGTDGSTISYLSWSGRNLRGLTVQEKDHVDIPGGILQHTAEKIMFYIESATTSGEHTTLEAGPTTQRRLKVDPNVRCGSQYGNPCGPLHHCNDTDNGFTCTSIEGIEGCQVGCEDFSTCVQDVSKHKFDCKCDYGYHRPDPFFQCKPIEGFGLISDKIVISWEKN